LYYAFSVFKQNLSIDLSRKKDKHEVMSVKKKKVKSFAKQFFQISALVFTIALLIILPLKTFYKPKNEYVGTYTVSYFDWNDHGSSSQKITLTTGEAYSVNFNNVDDPPEPNSYIKVVGEITDGVLIANSAVEITDNPAHPKESHAVSGKLKMLIMPIVFLGNQTDPISSTELNNTLFNDSTSVNNYYNKASYGIFQGIDQTTFKVVNKYTVGYPNPGKCSDYVSWATDAKAQASKVVNLSNYDRLLYIFSFVGTDNCWQGATKGNEIWINGNRKSGAFVHEISHTLGLGHADYCSDASCSSIQFGDATDIMGGGEIPAHHSAAFKYKLGWIPSTISATINETGTTYKIYPIEVKTSNLQTLQIPKADTGEYYYLTYRNKSDIFDNVSAIDKAVYLHIYTSKRGAGGDPSYPNTLRVKKLVTGGVYQDTKNGFELDVTAISSSYATIFIKKIPGNIGSNGTIVPPTNPPPSATPIPVVEVGGFVWDTNLNGVSGLKMAVEGYGSAGYWKTYNPVTASNGFFSQGGFIVYGGAYHIKGDGIAKTLTLLTARDTSINNDTPQGSTAYMNQKAGFLDCSDKYGDATYRCNFLYSKSLDTPSAISDITAFIWQEKSPPNAWRYKYRRIYLSTDGRSYYGKDCTFHTLIGYPQSCGGYFSGTVDTPGPVRGYAAFLFSLSGNTWVKHYYVGTDGLTTYTRTCSFNVDTGVTSACTTYTTGTVDTPSAVRDITAVYLGGQLRQSFISSDGTKAYARTCTFDSSTQKVTSCGSYQTTSSSPSFNGYAGFVYQGGYSGGQRVQQFLVGSDGRTPYFRDCVWNGADNISCPGFF
jgi:hypothetical protein